jgi:rhodanese-related sulfurtransferase
MYQNIDNAQFKRLMTQPGTVIFDVRTAKEVREGAISGATEFADINNLEEFETALKRLDKSKNYLMYCRSGARSNKACRLMEERGFKGNLYNLAMGISGWDGPKK